MPRVKLFDKDEVLEKAMHLFWERGYHATSIQDLVNHLGINRASLYDTFGGKQSLFDRAFEHYRETNTTAIKEFLHSEHNIKSGLRKLFLLALEQSKNDPKRKGCFVVNTTTEMLPDDVSTLSTLQENKQIFEKIYVDYLNLGVERGQISKSKNIQSIASLIYTMHNGLKVITKVNFDEKELIESVDTLLSILD